MAIELMVSMDNLIELASERRITGLLCLQERLFKFHNKLAESSAELSALPK